MQSWMIHTFMCTVYINLTTMFVFIPNKGTRLERMEFRGLGAVWLRKLTEISTMLLGSPSISYVNISRSTMNYKPFFDLFFFRDK